MSEKISTLIIPVENQVRELDSKLLIACSAAERGFPVIMGSQFFVYLNMPKFPIGVVFAKSMRSVNGMTLSLINHLGHDIVACDEEGLVRFDSPEYYAWRYSRRTFAAISRLFSWGENDAEMYASYEGYKNAPIHQTGNSRIDLLRPELRGVFQHKADAIRAQYGNFILINTNFSFVNNFVSGLNLMQRDSNGNFLHISRAGLGLSRKFAEGMANHQQMIYEAFRELLPRLCEWLPDTQFILRPHPSEDHEVWRKIIVDQKNMRVVHDGNVIPWLMACQCLLHNGCTTAVEATVLKVPTVTYQPICSEIYDYHLPNSLSHKATTPDEVRACLSAVINGEVGLISEQMRKSLFTKHLTSMDGTLAADKIINVLVDAGYLNRQPQKKSKFSFAYGWLGMTGRAFSQRIKMLQPNHRMNMKHHAHQFPYISEEELNLRIRNLGEKLQRFSGIYAEIISPYIFKIKNKSCIKKA